MRITNGMLINNTLNGLYKNMGNMDKLYAQMSTGKKIQTVSDDPIIAGRSLKLKTTVLETTQYESNAKEAASWMDVTESSLKNISDILTEIRTKCVQGANSSLSEKDKAALKSDIAQLYRQILQEANTTYGGRYVFSGYKTRGSLVLYPEKTRGSLVFSGYKTSEPLVLTQASKLEEDLVVSKDMAIPKGTEIGTGSVLKEGTTYGSGTVLGENTVIPGGSTLTEGTVLSKTDAEKILGIIPSDTEYTLSSDYTLTEGTELSKEAAKAILNVDVADGETYTIGKGGHTITQGTVLPKAVAEEVLGVTVSAESYTLTGNATVANDTQLTGNMTLGLDCKLAGDVELQGNSTLAGGTVLKEGSEVKAGSTFPVGAFNPKVYGKIDSQEIAYTVGVNNTINVNTLGLDSTLSNIMTSLEEMYTMIEDATNADGTFDDKKLYDLFNKKIGELDGFLEDISEKTADLGSRMARVEYVENRLADQKTTFKSLLSETEDIDIEEAYVEFNVQYATYQSALQATSKIITNTLADYL